MPETKAFFDTNVLLYLLSEDAAMADRSEELIAIGGVISVQVLNEFASVASRKLGMAWSEIRDVLNSIRTVCETEPVTVETHELGLEIAERYRLSFYDATIVASALRAGCETLYSEDLQDGQIINKQVRIRNPFASL
jgi:predicted nucleic acid-binding protein